MATNTWALGTMYYGGIVAGQPFFTQPGGPHTPVFPTQKNAEPWPDFPIPGMIINEYVPWWSPECGHSICEWSVIREFNYNTNSSCALITCRICNFIQAVYEPFENWLNPIEHAIVVA